VLNKRRFIVGAALIAAAVSYLVYAGIRTSSMYYFELEEFLAQRDARVGETMRVKGWVRADSIRWDPRTNDLSFDLARHDGTDPVPVSYQGILPDMFGAGREVVVEARWADGTLAARQILTSCPSKYEPGAEGAADAPA
jgi:cytochrome c-type biogenesis protein CcmE